MIDLHSHLLFGLDDGARDLDETLAIARSMAADGVTSVAATPHVRDDYPTTPEQMELRLADVRAAIGDAGIPLEVLPGGEIALDALPGLGEDARRRFGLGGNAHLLLLEFPYHGFPMPLTEMVWRLTAAGTVAVIAHPERNAEVQENPGRLADIVRAGGIVQLTAASVDGRVGKRAARCSRDLIELGLAHLIASDAHAPGVREAGLSAACKAVGDPALAQWLTYDTPKALLAGSPVPERPASRRRRYFGR
jgi:protein-tyrosine phosphatase